MIRAEPMKYPHLFQPLTVAGIELRNRVMMGSMHVGLEDRESTSDNSDAADAPGDSSHSSD